MSDELKPCPFCGGEASMESGRYQLDDVMYSFAHVECLSCGACGSGFTESESPVKQVEHLAADAWNRRAGRTCRIVSAREAGRTGYAPSCSSCGWQSAVWHQYRYCPNCGARVVDE